MRGKKFVGKRVEVVFPVFSSIFVSGEMGTGERTRTAVCPEIGLERREIIKTGGFCCPFTGDGSMKKRHQ